MFWSSAEYVDKKAEMPLQKLTDYLSEYKGFSSDESHLERDWFQEIFSDPCFTFNFHSNEDCAYRSSSTQYAVSEDGEKIYYYDTEKEAWTELSGLDR